MTKRIVKYKIDSASPPALTEKQKAEIAALKAMSDKDIDFSDIPATTDEDWKNAERGRFYRPIKTVTTLRIDADVLDWFKSQGKGFQTRMNAVLRDAMLKSSHHK